MGKAIGRDVISIVPKLTAGSRRASQKAIDASNRNTNRRSGGNGGRAKRTKWRTVRGNDARNAQKRTPTWKTAGALVTASPKRIRVRRRTRQTTAGSIGRTAQGVAQRTTGGSGSSVATFLT